MNLPAIDVQEGFLTFDGDHPPPTEEELRNAAIALNRMAQKMNAIPIRSVFDLPRLEELSHNIHWGENIFRRTQ